MYAMGSPPLDSDALTFRPSIPNDAITVHEVWARSVKATHDFLTPQDFEEISEIVRTQYAPVASLLLAELDDRIVGFMGMTDLSVDGLFIDPDHHGRGIGRAFIAEARKAGGPLTVDVNEQNTGALAFYERMGFEFVSRSEVDDEGRPYPLLHLAEPGH